MDGGSAFQVGAFEKGHVKPFFPFALPQGPWREGAQGAYDQGRLALPRHGRSACGDVGEEVVCVNQSETARVFFEPSDQRAAVKKFTPVRA